MRPFSSSLSFFTLCIFLSLASAVLLRSNDARLPSHLAQYSGSSAQHPSSRRPWTIVRDTIIHCVWSVPKERNIKQEESSKKSVSIRSGPPAKLLARYGGDVVLRFRVTSAEEAKALAEATTVLFLDIWEFNNEWVDLRLAKDVVPSLLGLLPTSLRHAHTPLMHDLAQTIYESYPSSDIPDGSAFPPQEHRAFSPSIRTSTDTESNVFFRDYQPLTVIVPWFRLLVSLFPTHVRLFNIGITYEGRDIPALRVGVHPTNSEKPSTPRKTIVIAGGSHAREWISTSTVNYVAYTLITSYGKSRKFTKLLEEFDWVFIPTLNPDGYVYTWESDRLWRKNRQQTSLRFCRGMDLDRGWGFEWDGENSKGNPCSESFPGEQPFQAVESMRLAEWAKNETEHNNVNFVGFLDLHSYSQQILYPYSYSCTRAPPSLENLEELAVGLSKAIRLSSGEIYSVTSACEGSVSVSSPSTSGASTKNTKKDKGVYPRMETGGGSALDWFYHEMRVKYAYQLKLRDTGSYGFLLPKENIVPTGKEIFSAVAYFGSFLLSDKGVELKEENEEEGRELGGGGGGEARPEDAMLKAFDLSDGLEEVPELQAGSEHHHEELNNEEGFSYVNWELKRRRRR
ncbi:MAG: putative metallocarboxypeptidase ecm14 [Pycnora praestabilis]|nr:MAG: putative metallocarboxypeptidase ecm14 [Pycnora praestabilis]